MIRTYATIGSPRCGKSTFWKKWLQEKDPTGLNKVVLCRDIFRLADYGERFNASREASMHEKFDVALRALHSTNDYIIGIDETHTTIRSIRNVLRLDIQTKFIFINTPYQTCIDRAYSSGQPDLAEGQVIGRMFDNLIKLCNYKVDKSALLPPLRYDLIREDYIYSTVEKIRFEEKNNA